MALISSPSLLFVRNHQRNATTNLLSPEGKRLGERVLIPFSDGAQARVLRQGLIPTEGGQTGSQPGVP